MSKQDLSARFWKKVIRGGPTECWIWTGSKLPTGYGQFWHGAGPHKAHRIAYMLCNGPFPKQLQVMHSCDNKSCVNPDHLSLGTHHTNMAQVMRRRLAQCPHSNDWGRQPRTDSSQNPVTIVQLFPALDVLSRICTSDNKHSGK